MKGYDAWGITPFQIEESELTHKFQKLNTSVTEEKLRMIRATFCMHALTFRIYFIPKEMKRSKWDHAKLLVISTADGKLWAKRYTNSQWIKLF